jgi:hypothetical protein
MFYRDDDPQMDEPHAEGQHSDWTVAAVLSSHRQRGGAQIDPSARVITFTGSASQYMYMTVDATNQGRSCNSKDIVNAAGTCFKTAAEYQCTLPAVDTGFHPYIAPPATF